MAFCFPLTSFLSSSTFFFISGSNLIHNSSGMESPDLTTGDLKLLWAFITHCSSMSWLMKRICWLKFCGALSWMSGIVSIPALWAFAPLLFLGHKDKSRGMPFVVMEVEDFWCPQPLLSLQVQSNHDGSSSVQSFLNKCFFFSWSFKTVSPRTKSW